MRLRDSIDEDLSVWAFVLGIAAFGVYWIAEGFSVGHRLIDTRMDQPLAVKVHQRLPSSQKGFVDGTIEATGEPVRVEVYAQDWRQILRDKPPPPVIVYRLAPGSHEFVTHETIFRLGNLAVSWHFFGGLFMLGCAYLIARELLPTSDENVSARERKS